MDERPVAVRDTMQVKDVMTRDVITCKPEDTIENVVRLMSEKDISGLPVVDGDEVLGRKRVVDG